MDELVVTAWRETTGDRTVMTVVEVSAEVSRCGHVLVVVDLSDSSPVANADLSRLRRLLASLPRGWTVAVAGLGGIAPTVPTQGAGFTVGDIVDGVVDLAAAFTAAASGCRRSSASKSGRSSMKGSNSRAQPPG